MQLNPCLSERVVKDLNKDSSLPFESNSFDVVLCQLSIDYLTQPVAFSKEAFRVLRPGVCIVHFVFSVDIIFTIKNLLSRLSCFG